VHLIGIPITATSVNPARSLGPALIVGGTALSQVWLFIVAPLAGGALAAAVHWLIFPPSPGSVDTEQAELAEEAQERRTA
jgi:aquaporin Z